MPSRQDLALSLLERLTNAFGAPGSEDDVRHLVAREWGGQLRCDRLGSLLREFPGRAEAPRVMLTAHQDEVGFAVRSFTDDGLLKVVPLGGWWGHTLPAQRLRLRRRDGSELLGVFAATPMHLLKSGEKDRVLKVEELFVDVGASSRQELTDLRVNLGDPLVPATTFTPLGREGRYLAKAFDNRVGTALLTQSALELGDAHPNTVVGVATVQEELGCRGAQTAVAAARPDVAIVLEGAPADDLPGTPQAERQGVLGAGVQIRLLDPSTLMNRKLVALAEETAAKHGIACQVAVRHSGATDAKAIHLHEQGVPTVVLGVPSRYIHSHNSMIDLGDYLAALDLVAALVPRLDPDTVDDLLPKP